MTNLGSESDSFSLELAPRNMSTLLNETFAIYGRHLWRFLGLVAIVQAPVGVVSVILFAVLDGGTVTFVLASLLGLVGIMFTFSAGIYAVGQHYVIGQVEIGPCFARSWRRVVSLAVLTMVALSVLVIFTRVLATLTNVVLDLSFARNMIIVAYAALWVAVVASIYVVWITMVNSVVVQGHKAVRAIKRGFALIKGNWFRLLGTTLVTGLVAFGLAILVTIPFVLVTLATGFDPTTADVSPFQVVGSLVVEIVVPPVLFITGALLYYDVRVRKEDFDLATLSHELGIVAV